MLFNSNRCALHTGFLLQYYQPDAITSAICIVFKLYPFWLI